MTGLRASVLVGLACWSGSLAAHACPCSDDPGSGAFLTRVDETYAFAFTASSRRALGTFDVEGNVHDLRQDELQASEELLLRTALRYPERLEWQAELGAASFRFHSSTFSESQRGLGDALLRARYLVRQQDMPQRAWVLPALSAALLVRAPLGVMTSSRSTSFGSGGAQLGLGAWELGAGVDISRSAGPFLTLALSAEAGYRLADRALGRSRQLGPRLDLALAGDLALADWLSATLALGSRFVGDVTLSGQRLDDTAERLVSLSAALGVRQPSGFRSSLGIRVDPPIAQLSMNAVATATLSATLGLAF